MPPIEPTDPIEALRERLRATQQAAERLAGDPRVPPQGWATPPAPELDDRLRDDVAAIVALLQALRELVPAELHAHVVEIVRHVLLLLRAVLDWWLARLDARRGTEPVVEDIPVA